MKINKNILASVLAVAVTLSIMIRTLLYAQQYTATHAYKSNSFQRGDGTRPQGEFQNKDGNNSQGVSPSGDFKKTGN